LVGLTNAASGTSFLYYYCVAVCFYQFTLVDTAVIDLSSSSSSSSNAGHAGHAGHATASGEAQGGMALVPHAVASDPQVRCPIRSLLSLSLSLCVCVASRD
jgi:hypothetical protein